MTYTQLEDGTWKDDNNQRYIFHPEKHEERSEETENHQSDAEETVEEDNDRGDSESKLSQAKIVNQMKGKEEETDDKQDSIPHFESSETFIFSEYENKTEEDNESTKKKLWPPEDDG